MTIKTDGLGGYLTKEQAGPIFERAAQSSVITTVSQEVALGLGGAEVPVFTGDLAAEWVDEAGKKPVSNGGIHMSVIKPRKIAVIVPLSNEAVRAAGGVLTDMISNKVGDAFANKIDREVFYGSAGLARTTKSVEIGTSAPSAGGVYGDIVAAKKLLFNSDKDATAIVGDRRLEVDFDGAVDTTGRAIFSRNVVTDNDVLTYGQAVGLNAAFKRGLYDNSAKTLGYIGDFSQVAYGILSGVNIRVSDQGTVVDGAGNTLSAVQHNLTFLICETEVGLLVNDAESFVKLTDKAEAPAEG